MFLNHKFYQLLRRFISKLASESNNIVILCYNTWLFRLKMLSGYNALRAISSQILGLIIIMNVAPWRLPDFWIENTEKWRSLETASRKESSWENSNCVTVKLWHCRRPTAFHDPTCHSQISATDADCAWKIETHESNIRLH